MIKELRLKTFLMTHHGKTPKNEICHGYIIKVVFIQQLLGQQPVEISLFTCLCFGYHLADGSIMNSQIIPDLFQCIDKVDDKSWKIIANMESFLPKKV
jgi:hypothetical protein